MECCILTFGFSLGTQTKNVRHVYEAARRSNKLHQILPACYSQLLLGRHEMLPQALCHAPRRWFAKLNQLRLELLQQALLSSQLQQPGGRGDDYCAAGGVDALHDCWDPGDEVLLDWISVKRCCGECWWGCSGRGGGQDAQHRAAAIVSILRFDNLQGSGSQGASGGGGSSWLPTWAGGGKKPSKPSGYCMSHYKSIPDSRRIKGRFTLFDPT